MKTVKLYNGEVTVEFDDEAHCYVWKEIGLPVRGFSSIKDRMGIGPAIAQWKVNCAIEHITNAFRDRGESGDMWEVTSFLATCQEAKTADRRISKVATNIGSIVHKFCEQLLLQKSAALPSDPQAAKGANAFLTWYHTHKIEPIAIERIVLSKEHYYAGTVDFFGRIDGQLCVLDFKTSSGFYPEMILQLCAYAVALEEEHKQHLDTGYVVRLDKKSGKCEVYSVPLLDEYKNTFIKLAAFDKGMKTIEETLDGIRQSARAAA